MPAPRDEDAPEDDGLDGVPDRGGEDGWWDPDEDDDDLAGTGPGPVWPQLGTIPPALARPTARPGDGRPVPGLLDVTLPWLTLAGRSDAPGLLGRIGPITATQARYLAAAAATDPAVQWRVIVTNPAGQAIAVSRIRRRARASPVGGQSCRDGPGRGSPPGTGLAGRVTLTITQHTITAAQQTVAGTRPPARAGPLAGADPPGETGPPASATPPGGITAAALRAATQRCTGRRPRPTPTRPPGAARTPARHGLPATAPAPRLRGRPGSDLPFPSCGQPAWRGDLDHTQPWDQAA